MSASTMCSSNFFPMKLLMASEDVSDFHGFLIRPVRRHRVEGIGDAHDLRLEGNLVAFEPVRISRTVDVLVMAPDARHHMFELRDVFHDRGAHRRVGLHDRVFLIGQRPRFSENAVLDSDLSHVVHESGNPNDFRLVFRQPENLRDRG